ncbi:hypothetical protein L1049_010530 [Liquidambar formosana]|uniref:Uncharacterized protein n=1 Tax=Liquidambar formosana TaxID=63359 RepID=A0AAP0N9C5_LIQFO
MGFPPTKAIVLSMLLVSCIAVFAEEVDTVTESLPPIPPHHHPGYLGPVAAPIYPPSHHHNSYPPVHPPSHHHHKGHPPSHPPVHPPTHAPAHPPSPHHHKGHPPTHSPVHPPSHPPVHPPSHPPSSYFPKRSFIAVQGVVYCKSCKFNGIDTLLGASPLPGAVVKLQCNNTKYPLVQQATTDKNGYFFIQAPKKITTFGAHKCKASLVSSPLSSCSKPTDLHAGLKGAMLMPEKPPVDTPPPPFALYSVGPFAFEPAQHC